MEGEVEGMRVEGMRVEGAELGATVVGEIEVGETVEGEAVGAREEQTRMFCWLVKLSQGTHSVKAGRPHSAQKALQLATL